MCDVCDELARRARFDLALARTVEMRRIEPEQPEPRPYDWAVDG